MLRRMEDGGERESEQAVVRESKGARESQGVKALRRAPTCRTDNLARSSPLSLHKSQNTEQSERRQKEAG